MNPTHKHTYERTHTVTMNEPTRIQFNSLTIFSGPLFGCIDSFEESELLDDVCAVVGEPYDFQILFN